MFVKGCRYPHERNTVLVKEPRVGGGTKMHDTVRFLLALPFVVILGIGVGHLLAGIIIMMEMFGFIPLCLFPTVILLAGVGIIKSIEMA